jgi:hypothetical protein
MAPQSPPWKQIVREQLETLASESEQLEYERRVPKVDITAELVSGWFDDTYHPEDLTFSQCFTANELRELAAFSTFFEGQLKWLPRSQGTVKTWLADSVWREVMNHAAQTMHGIAV